MQFRRESFAETVEISHAIRAGRTTRQWQATQWDLRVTTAVYWGLLSASHPRANGSLLTFQHRKVASVRIHRLGDFAMDLSFSNSRSVFLRPGSRSHRKWVFTIFRPPSRSYGGILPSSLTIVTLYLTTCVGFRSGRVLAERCAFLGSRGSPNSPSTGYASPSGLVSDGFAPIASLPAPVLPPRLHGQRAFLRHPFA